MKTIVLSGSLGLGLALASSAGAGLYTDDLARCMVGATTADDRAQLVRWFFVMGSSHPALAGVAAVSEQQREDANRGTAQLFTRLLTESCVDQTRKALQYEGAATIQQSFGVLGEVAGRELYSNPVVLAQVQSLTKYIDETKFAALALPQGGAAAPGADDPPAAALPETSDR